jgi:16S rRNA processing protein RimM
MTAGPQPAALPPDAVEVGRIADAWGVKGWFKVAPYSASAEALFSSRRWFAQGLGRGPLLLAIDEVRRHGDALLASAREAPDRAAAEQLKGARLFIARADFPAPAPGEYYWVDLIGLAVFNREGVALGQVQTLLANGAQDVLVVSDKGADPKPVERLIPFVDAYIDNVDLPGRRITVDWQADY